MHDNENGVMSPSGTFYCWECVSLITRTRTVDFVIKKRSYMLAFLQIIISHMNKNYRTKLRRDKVKKLPFLQRLFKRIPQVELRPANLIYYKILMLKMKISYMAWD